MKNLLKLICVVAVSLLLPLQGMAKDIKPNSSESIDVVREEIIRLIGQPDLSEIDEKQMESTLHFMVTSSHELVVLRVETKHEFLDRYLKRKLNYRKVSSTNVFGRYAMKITLKNGSR